MYQRGYLINNSKINRDSDKCKKKNLLDMLHQIWPIRNTLFEVAFYEPSRDEMRGQTENG
jgi:hypothetical protein